MSAQRLIQWSGLGTAIGGVLLALFPLLHPNHDEAGFTSWLWIPAHTMIHVGIILALFGLIGLFVRQFERAGWLGFAGFLTAFVGTAGFLTIAMVELFIMPYLALQLGIGEDGPPPPGIGEAMMLISLTFGVGYIILGVATIRAHVLPRSVGILLAVAAVYFTLGERLLSAVVDMERFWGLSFAFFGAALIWFGYALWSDLAHQRQPRRSNRAPRVVSAAR